LMSWLFAAYAVVWIAIFLFMLGVDRRQRALAEELETLKGKLRGEDRGGSRG
jgi:CcmD family protein